MLVGRCLALRLRIRLGDLATHVVALEVLDLLVRKHPLEARSLDGAGREGVAEEHRGLLARNHLDPESLKIAPIEHAPVAVMPRRAGPLLAQAEIVLAAHEQR